MGRQVCQKAGIRTKTLGMSIAINVFLIAVGTFGVYSSHRVVEDFNHVADVNLKKTKLLGAMRGQAKDSTRNVIRLFVPGSSKAETDHVVSKLKKLSESFKAISMEYAALPFDEGEKELYDKVQTASNLFFDAEAKLVELSFQEGEGAKGRAIEFLNNVYRKNYDTVMFPALDKLIEYQDVRSDAWADKAEAGAKRANWMMIAATLIGSAVSLFVGLWISGSLTRTLISIASRLSQQASRVASSSQTVSVSSEQISSAANEQSSSLVETSSSVNEISSMVEKNADNAHQSKTAIEVCQESAGKGRQAIERMLGSIAEIDASNGEIMKQVELSNRNLSEIVKVITEIGSKTKVINDIVFQTKLLSFNASVEAARAGEYGKGFAVVAEEVGSLAQMSGVAAKEISSMLEESVQKVESIVSETQQGVGRSIESGKRKVSAGVEVAQQCSAILVEISESVNEASRLVGEIAAASSEQSSGIKQINQAVGQLDEVTQQNASASQRTAESAIELSAQALGLEQVVRELLATINGGAGATGSVGTGNTGPMPRSSDPGDSVSDEPRVAA